MTPDTTLAQFGGIITNTWPIHKLLYFATYLRINTYYMKGFRVVIEGADKSGNKVQRWNAQMEIPTTISLEVVSTADGVFTVTSGHSIGVSIITGNSGSSAFCVLTLTDSLNYFQSVNPSRYICVQLVTPNSYL